MGEHEMPDETPGGAVDGAHEEHRDPGNTDPGDLTEELTDEELTEILARFRLGRRVAADGQDDWAGGSP